MSTKVNHQLCKILNVRKVDKQRQPVKWLNIQWPSVKLSEPTKLYYKYSVQDEVEFNSINLARSGRSPKVSDVIMEPLYTAPRALSAEKVKDIRKLLQYVPTSTTVFMIL